MMEKYGDLTGEGEIAEIKTGPLAGSVGIVKEAQNGLLKIQLKDGATVSVDEMDVVLKEKK